MSALGTETPLAHQVFFFFSCAYFAFSWIEFSLWNTTKLINITHQPIKIKKEEDLSTLSTMAEENLILAVIDILVIYNLTLKGFDDQYWK